METQSCPRSSFVARRPWLVVAGWLLAVAASLALATGLFSRLVTDTGMDERSESYRAYQLLTDTFPGQIPDLTVLYSSDTLTVDDPAFVAAVTRTLGDLPADRHAQVVNGLAVPPSAGLVSPDRHAVKVVVSLPDRGEDTGAMLADYEALRPHLDADDARIRTDVSGIAPMGSDILERSARDTERAELIALPIVFLLGLVIFGGLVAALVPTLLGAVSIAISLGVLSVLTRLTDVATQGLMVVTLLGMGLAVDYSLFIISRFREELGDGRGREAARAAATRTIATAGRTVGVSALVVAVALAGLLVFPITTMRSMTYGAIPAVLGCALAATTLLPAALSLLGHRINALRLPFVGLRRDADHGVWARIAHAVMRRPWMVLLASTAFLLLLAAPFAGVRWGGMDESLLPRDAPARVALEREAQHFGGASTWAYAMVEGADAQAVADYAGRLAQVPGVASVAPTLQQPGTAQPVTMLTITWHGSAQSEASRDTVQLLRAVDPSTGKALVGGPPAITVDTVHTLGSHLPAMLVVMGAAMLLLLGAAFRSGVLPVKAVVMSLLSIAASYGVLTWVFQDGHGASWLGFDSPGYLETMTPVVAMAVLFGLSMDYEVFMLSRMKEAWDAGASNADAVATGLARTGRLITGAALLLAVVIGGFATSGILVVKILGLGMLVAVLLDATVVRGLLVPATMRLLGRWNWWPGSRRSDLADGNLEHVGG